MKFWKKKDKPKTTTNPFEEQSEPINVSIKYSSNTMAVESGGYSSTNIAKSRDITQDRQQLFGGYSDRNGLNELGSQNNNSLNSYEEDEDDEVVQIKQKIRNVKQESLESTRNALQKIGEAEMSANTTMNLLGTQSYQIANVERSVDLSKAYSDRASVQAGELKKLNRSIFVPAISNPFTKSSRDKAVLEELNREHAEHIAERDEIRKYEFDSSARIEEAQRQANLTKVREGRQNGRTQNERNRYQFEADEEDDVIEDEISQNLDLLSDATSRLKLMATTMNSELDSQNQRLTRLNKKVDPISEKLVSTTHRLNSTR